MPFARTRLGLARPAPFASAPRRPAIPTGTGTRLSSIGGAVGDVWARSGWRGFYRGAAASTARAIMVTCSRLVAYEQAKALLGAY